MKMYACKKKSDCRKLLLLKTKNKKFYFKNILTLLLHFLIYNLLLINFFFSSFKRRFLTHCHCKKYCWLYFKSPSRAMCQLPYSPVVASVFFLELVQNIVQSLQPKTKFEPLLNKYNILNIIILINNILKHFPLKLEHKHKIHLIAFNCSTAYNIK